MLTVLFDYSNLWFGVKKGLKHEYLIDINVYHRNKWTQYRNPYTFTFEATLSLQVISDLFSLDLFYTHSFSSKQ